MDCASKRITQGHRILKPKQVRREILVYSFPTFSYPLETPRNSAPERCEHRVKTFRSNSNARPPTLEMQTLPIENQYFKSYKMESSFGSFSSSCFNIE